MAVNQWAPRLHKIDIFVTIHIDNYRPTCLLEVDRVAVDRLESPHRGVYPSDQVYSSLGMQCLRVLSLHDDTALDPTFSDSFPRMVTNYDVRASPDE